MELATTRFSFAFVVSAALHAIVAAALLGTVTLGPAASLEPAAILVDLRWVEVASVATAPRLGPTQIAPGPSATVDAPATAALLEPSPPRPIAREQPPVGARKPQSARPKPTPAAVERASNGEPSAPAQPATLASAASGVSVSTQPATPAAAPGLAGVGPGSTAPTVGSAIRVRYEQQLYVWLARFKQYPMMARRRGIEGRGSVRVRLDRRGRVLERSVERSTGERMLDDAAVEMTRRADPFPPVPGDYSGESFEFVAPIEFRLR
ncbi:MAG: energy transducer TonB [Deltaproteobacteria bacterium]|nr:energy transducer TonB [Deltaproteobacteria bacterium]